MKDDLLYAESAVDWAITNLPSFEDRLKAWCDDNIYPAIVKLPAENPDDLLVAREKIPLPLSFNVEFGAYLNAIRSSLDMVAWAVKEREKAIFPDEVYFPIAESAEKFAAWDYKGSKFVRQLSRTYRDAFEAGQPYKRGNEALSALHHLNNIGKHKRLLSTYTRPGSFHVRGFGIRFRQAASFIQGGEGETVLGFIAKGSQPEVVYTGNVVINEPSLLEIQSVTRALHIFGKCAKAIILLFDF